MSNQPSDSPPNPVSEDASTALPAMDTTIASEKGSQSESASQAESGGQQIASPDHGDQVAPLDYKALARFLLEPLTDQPEELHISSEVTAHNKKVSIRVSLGRAERGRAFGRGGRNIRAIRTILRAAGQNVGQNVSLEIIGDDSDRAKPKPRKAGSPRPVKPKPKPKR